MSSHYEWDTKEEIARNNARADANNLQRQQQFCKQLRNVINKRMESMNTDQLMLMGEISYSIDDYKTFFKVLKNIK